MIALSSTLGLLAALVSGQLGHQVPEVDAQPILELVRLGDLDLRPASRWPDLTRVSEWIPFEDGVAFLQPRDGETGTERWLVVRDGEGGLNFQIRLPTRIGDSPGEQGGHFGGGGTLCCLDDRCLGILPAVSRQGSLVGVQVARDRPELRPWPIAARVDLGDTAALLPAGDLLVFREARGDTGASLRRFAPDGTERWARTESERLCRGRTIRLAGDGRILVLNTQAPIGVQFVSRTGVIGRFVRLAEAWPGLQALHDVRASANGELCFDVTGAGVRVLVRTDAEVRVLGRLVPRFADGSTEYRSMRCTENGSIWVYDGYCFARLDEQGATASLLGPPPGVPVLPAARWVSISNEGRIFACSARDQRAFELDVSGHILRTAVLDRDPVLGHVEDIVDELLPDPEHPQRFAHLAFDAGRRRWTIEGDTAVLRDATATVLARAAVLPHEGPRMEWGPVAVSPLGRLAVVSKRVGAAELALFDTQAKLLFRVPLDTQGDVWPDLAVDEQYVAVTSAGSVDLYDSNGRRVARAALPRHEHRSCGLEPDLLWRVHLRTEAAELWLREGPATLTIRRYALP